MSKLDEIRERVNTLTVSTSIAAIDRAYLLKRVESLERALRALTADCHAWQADVEKIIGRQPRADWPALRQAEAALAELEE